MSESTKSEASSTKKIGAFLQKNFTKGELALKHAVGLGQTPNVVPVGEPSVGNESRQVEVGWHPVGGLAGKWFAEQTGLGKLITEKINKYPDPTQHWAVLVGDYVHQLWMDENFHVIYINDHIKREEWRTFKVGKTHLNDDAIRRAGEAVIQGIRDKQPAYNLITNNCQTYALQLLDAIKASGHKEFGTTLEIYDRLFGTGKVSDLFQNPETGAPIVAVPPASGVPPPPLAEGEEAQVPPPLAPPPPAKSDDDDDGPETVSFAQQVMNDNTNQLDTQEQQNSRSFSKTESEGDDDTQGKSKNRKSKIFSSILKRLK